jgi:hypothetical protein
MDGRSFWDMKPEHKQTEDSKVRGLHKKWAQSSKVSENSADNIRKLIENVMASEFRHLKVSNEEKDPLKGFRTRHLKGLFHAASRGDNEYELEDCGDEVSIRATRHSPKGNSNVKQVTTWRIKDGKVVSAVKTDRESGNLGGQGGSGSYDPNQNDPSGRSYRRGKEGIGSPQPSVKQAPDSALSKPRQQAEPIGKGIVRRRAAGDLKRSLINLAKSKRSFSPTTWQQRNHAFAHIDAVGDLGKADLKHNQKIRDIADAYAKENGITVKHDIPRVDVSPEFAGRLAQAFHEMKHDPSHPDTQKAYSSLIDETTKQLHHLQRHGLKFSKIQNGQENPYKAGSKELFRDIDENNHIWYFPTESGFGTETSGGSDHPLLKPVKDLHGNEMPANDAFRIVHDVFGHAKEKHGFGPKGEENAWRHHAQMFSPLAVKALTSETRGQNSWVNFGPHAENNRKNPANTIYADQKAGLLPDWTLDHPEKVGKSMGRSLLAKGQKGDWKKEGYSLSHSKGNEDHLSPGGFGRMISTVTAKAPNGDYAGHIEIETGQHENGDLFHTIVSSRVLDGHRRKGLASSMYELAENHLKSKLTPSILQSDDAKALWSQPNRKFGKSSECKFAKSQQLEKRSKNVREQTRNITEDQAVARRLAYAKRLGVSPFDKESVKVRPESYRGFPDQRQNVVTYSSAFPIEHELAHAMMTPDGETISSYTKKISNNETTPSSKTEENIANQVENRIDRRAGVGIGEKGSKRSLANKMRFNPQLPVNNNDETEQYKAQHNLKIFYNDDTEAAKALGQAFGRQAKKVLERFDNGAKFNELGEVVEPAGVNAKINRRNNKDP